MRILCLGVTRIANLKFVSLVLWRKKIRVKFGTIVHHTKGMLDYVHSDV